MNIDYDIKSAAALTDEELIYLREHPDALAHFLDREQITSKVLKKFFFVAVFFIAGSKLANYYFADVLGDFVTEVIADTIFELGASMLGACATVFFIQYEEKRQFEANTKLHADILTRIERLQKRNY